MGTELARRVARIEINAASAGSAVIVVDVLDAPTLGAAWFRDHGDEPMPSRPTVVWIDDFWAHGKAGPTPFKEAKS